MTQRLQQANNISALERRKERAIKSQQQPQQPQVIPTFADTQEGRIKKARYEIESAKKPLVSFKSKRTKPSSLNFWTTSDSSEA